MTIMIRLYTYDYTYNYTYNYTYDTIYHKNLTKVIIYDTIETMAKYRKNNRNNKGG